MIIETKSMYCTPADGNVFADLGFEPDEAATLQAASKKIIAEKVAIKEHLFSEGQGRQRRKRRATPKT